MCSNGTETCVQDNLGKDFLPKGAEFRMNPLITSASCKSIFWGAASGCLTKRPQRLPGIQQSGKVQ